MSSPMQSTWSLLKCSAGHWVSDEAGTIGAALAFYCAFSLAPLLIIIVTISGWIAGETLAYGHLSTQLTGLFGQSTADVLLEAMKSSQRGGGTLATIVSVLSLIVGASTVFAALEAALEQIWGSKSLAPTGIRGFIRTRLLSFGLILAVGFLLLISLTLSTALTALRGAIAVRFTGFVVAAGLLDLLLSTAMITGLIALIYRYMPARRLPWRPVIWGALVTALLFYVGRWLISLYLGSSTQPSAYGAAASFAALLLWLYYSAQIFLFGAEFTACLGGLRNEAAEPMRARSDSLTASADSRTRQV